MVDDATREVKEREKETLLRLARAGEFRDEETGSLIRMSRYSRRIANTLGLERDEAETMELAAPLRHRQDRHPGPDSSQAPPPGRGRVAGHAPSPGDRSRDPQGQRVASAWARSSRSATTRSTTARVPERARRRSCRSARASSPWPMCTTRSPRCVPSRPWPSEQAFEYLHVQAGRHFDPHGSTFLAALQEVLEIQHEWRDPTVEALRLMSQGFIARLRAPQGAPRHRARAGHPAPRHHGARRALPLPDALAHRGPGRCT